MSRLVQPRGAMLCRTGLQRIPECGFVVCRLHLLARMLQTIAALPASMQLHDVARQMLRRRHLATRQAGEEAAPSPPSAKKRRVGTSAASKAPPSPSNAAAEDAEPASKGEAAAETKAVSNAARKVLS